MALWKLMPPNQERDSMESPLVLPDDEYNQTLLNNVHPPIG